MKSRRTKAILAAAAVLLIAAVGVVAKRKLRWQPPSSGGTPSASETFRVAKPLEAADAVEVIFDGQLTPGWNDWGWGPHEYPAHSPAKIVFSGYGGIILQHASVQKPIGAFSFRFKAPADWGNFLAVSLKLAGSPDSLFKTVVLETRFVAKLPDGFQEVLIPWAELNPSNAPFDRLTINAILPVGQQPVLLDKIFLVKSTSTAAAPGEPGKSPTRPVELAILCSSEVHAISPLIYGSAGGDWESNQTAERLGGNTTTRFNWDLKAWNSGNDWFFENGNGLDVGEWLEKNVSHQARSAVTVPTIGWVAKDTSSFGFPASLYAKQGKFDPYRAGAGDGMSPEGKPLPSGPPDLTSVPAPPELIGRWVRELREKDQRRGARSIAMYILDNEPTLWDTTHRDVHPKPLTYDELLDRTIRYATEVRRADPDVKIAGPAEWGWMGYFYSGQDRVDGKFVRSDRRAHGDEPLLAWYLKKLAQYEKEHGTRLLDVLDVHFYPAAEGLFGANARTDPEAAELRVRSTRGLWDESYVDESWINEPVRLIPRLKEWVAANYPSVGISIGEWSFGADAHISGALATAEALGRFGQQGLYSAFYWQGPAKASGALWAFRAYTNFDGAGARFLDFSVPTRESGKVSLFASRDPLGRHMVAVMLNRDPVFAANARINLGRCGRLTSQRVFGYEAGSTSLTLRETPPSPRDRLVITAPPYSISVIDMQLDDAI